MELENELDCSWVRDFEYSEQEYSYFYKEKTESIKIICIYVDETNSIHNVHQETFLIEDRKVDKDKVIEIIKTHRSINKYHYRLISILKYNITLEPEHIKKYLVDDINNEFDNEFLSKVDILQDIYFKDTINLFQDLNSLYFIFCNKKARDNTNKITKKIILKLPSIKKNKKSRKIL
jgi:hypothetical protein